MKWIYKKEQSISYNSHDGKQIVNNSHWVIDETGHSIALMASIQESYRSESNENLRAEHAKLIAITPEMLELISKLSNHRVVVCIDSLQAEAKALIAKLKE